MAHKAAPAVLERIKMSLGVLCLGSSLVLMSPGVAVVRAEDTIPEKATPITKPIRVVPAQTSDGRIIESPRANDAGPDVSDAVITLNTRGYNYGPERPTVQPVAPPAPAAPTLPAAPASAAE